MTTTNQLQEIYKVLNNTEIDTLFIESATALGYSDYFANLDLNQDDELAVAKCYHRVIRVLDNIPVSLMPESFLAK